jgi:hypothetical protein
MIFDADAIKVDVVEWQRTKSSAALERIYVGTTKLIEAIVSYYDPIFRDDMIQECRLKLINGALMGYDEYYSLHTYLTTVFHNCCRTYMKKQCRIAILFEDHEIAEQPCVSDILDDDIIDDVICRNRKRFPSLPSEVIDDITEYIMTRLSGNIGKRRGLVAEIMKNFYVSRHVATVVYHSTMVYLRGNYGGNVHNRDEALNEFSLLPDLCDELGETAVNRLILLFSGLCVRIP